MATTTTNYSFTLPTVGAETDQWGSQLNANWTLADSTLKTIEDSVGDDVTLTGNDYLTISGQVITVGDVDLTEDVTGVLPVASGGTGLAALGTANQVLGVNSGGTALEYKTLSTGGTVTSVAVTGADGIEVDSGSPVTTSGTITLGINATTLSTHLGLGDLATQSTITESQISDLGSYITASSTDTLTNKSGNISQWTNDAGYLTTESNNLSTVSGTLGTSNGGTGLTAIVTANQVLAVNSGATGLEFQTISITESQISDLQSYLTAEVNDLSAAVTWANVPDVNITQSSVTQHQAALSITESQISDLQSYLTAEANDLSSSVTWVNVPDANITESSVTQHEAALTITESQISDLGSYQPSDAGLTSISGLTTAADKMLYTTAADTYAVTALTTAGRALLDDADAVAQRTTLGLGTAATSNTSAFEASGAVSTHAAATSSVHGISAFGATLVDDADATAARTTLGLGTAATTATTDYATATQGATADSALQDLVEDLSPQLGGNLDVNGQSIVSVSAGNISITPDTTGKIVLDGLSWPTSDGTTDQVLQTDGAGNLSFVDQPSGGITTGKAIAMAIVFG